MYPSISFYFGRHPEQPEQLLLNTASAKVDAVIHALNGQEHAVVLSFIAFRVWGGPPFEMTFTWATQPSARDLYLYEKPRRNQDCRTETI